MSDLFKNLFIFEMANNHQGSVAHGLKIIESMSDVASKHSIRAGIKFQYRDLDTFIHPLYADRKDLPHIPRFFETRLTDVEFRTLVQAVREKGMTTICTPFDEPSVRKLVDHGIQIIKVGSCSAQDWPLLEAVAAVDKPIIVSTGGLSIQEIDAIVSFFSHRNVDFALMHCVALYPTPRQNLCLGFINKLARRYPGIPVGYSGHEDPDDTDVVKMAVSKGAAILERHVGVATDSIRLNGYSMTPEQTDHWVEAALGAREVCGGSEGKEITEAELASLRSLKRGVFASRSIARGDTIKRDDVFFAMPCHEGQTTSGEFGQYRASFVAARDYERFERIEEHREPDLISFTREIIHEAKGMINEANITTGDDIEIELSHHYGITNFRQNGAVLLNLINREYCEKLIVVLPGQQHPSHLHKIKEETFQLLWGDLEVKLEGQTVKMKPGDKVLVHPGVFHSFGSQTGAIFQEISTRNIKNDSYYEDERIRILDPMERKTILDSW
jgi:sialic acid synthase SpsE/quercetin dioxygenase-like cupin family protein